MDRLREWLKRYWLDVSLGVLSVLFGLVSVAYPFGRDQGLYFYVSREWVQHGAVPYRDILDHKTPGIYLVYALAVRIFGANMWGIRVFDLLAVFGVSMVAATFSALPDEKVRPGVRGGTWLVTSVLFYGFLNFWNSAQSEIYYSLLAVSAVAVVLRQPKQMRAAIAAGALIGGAMLMKPPAIWTCLIAVGFLVERLFRAKRQAPMKDRLVASAIALGALGAGAALVVVPVLGYFAAKHAIPAMIDIVVGANGYYVAHERGVPDVPGALYGYHRFNAPLVPAILLYLACAFVFAFRKKDTSAKRRHFVALLLVAAAYGAVAMQGKFYLLHWTPMIPAFAAVVANALRGLGELAERRGGTVLWLAHVPLLFCLWGMNYWIERNPQAYYESSRHTYRWLTGAETRAEWADHFKEPMIGFFWQESEAVGEWLKEHSTPDDLVTVRGFEPQIYAPADRHHGGRFFWTTFITNPSRAYRREEWLAEDRQTFIDHPPRYVVAYGFVPEGPDSVAFFTAMGYREVKRIARFTILERAAQGT